MAVDEWESSGGGLSEEEIILKEAEAAWEVVRATFKPSDSRLGELMRDVAREAYIAGYKAAARGNAAAMKREASK